MTRLLILARHGQTRANAEGRFISATDPGLDSVGHRQARALGEQLSGTTLDLIVSSPRRRCVETMTAVAAAQAVTPVTRLEEGLAELRMGALEGLSPSDIDALGIRETFEEWRQGIPPGYAENAEHFEDAALRVVPVFDEVARLDATNVMLVGYSHALRIILAVAVLFGPAEMHRRLFLGHATITAVRWELGTPRIVTLNGVRLEDDDSDVSTRSPAHGQH